jgi:anti-sigma28 factor (negative regulator of flagellin synthesis)
MDHELTKWERDMNIQSSANPVGEPRKGLSGSDAAKASAGASTDPAKQATIAQSTVRAVHEALVKVGAAVVQPSAQLSVDSSKLARISSAEKPKDAEKLDTAKLDAIKAKIESGDFDFDYAMIASQLASQSGRRVSSAR